MKIQQGDVLLTKITDEAWSKQVERSSHGSKESTGVYGFGDPEGIATVALGEATGHHHSVTGGPGHAQSWFVGWRMPSDDNPLRSNYLNVKAGDVTMTHQEHNPVTIPAGKYRVSIVREFDHMSQHTRMVVD